MYSGGWCGIPCGFAVGTDPALSLADVAGTGRNACAGEGLAGSRGGVFILDFGIDEVGWECRTSFLFASARGKINIRDYDTYPACIWIKESPPNAIIPDLVHLATSIEEDS